MRLFFATLLTCLFGFGPAWAQSFTPVGLWNCTVNAISNAPSGNYGLEVQMEVAPDGRLFARGVVIYPQLRNNLQNVEGYGDWTLLPPDPGNSTPLYKFRMHPQNHAIISWFVRPVGPGQMYNLFEGRHPNGVQSQVETQCGKFG